MTADLTTPEARPHRDALADRTDALDRVKALRLLPGDTYATTDLVAGYYGVDKYAIEKVTQRNRAELNSDGYCVLRGSELTDILSITSLDQRVSALAVFPRRAILRVGMLLRDSAVARAVRDALLDIERSTRLPLDVNGIDREMLARWVIEAEQARKVAEAELADAQFRALAGATFKTAVEGGEGTVLTVFHKTHFSGVRHTDFFEALYTRGLLIDQRHGRGWDAKNRRWIPGREHRHPTAAGKAYFKLAPHLDRDGVERAKTVVRPGRPALDLITLLRDRCGFTPNEDPTTAIEMDDEAALFQLDSAISTPTLIN